MENNLNQNNGAVPPPPPKQEFYLPTKFWLDVLTHLDSKMRILCEDYGHGKIGLTIKVHKSKITEVEFNDDIRIRSLIEALGPKAVQDKPLEEKLKEQT